MNATAIKTNISQIPAKVLLFFCQHLSAKSKRLCYISSLYASLTGCKENEVTRLTEVNQALHLSRDVNALRFPTLIAPMIWRVKTERITMLTGKPEQQVGRLLRLTPCWLRYADEDTMRKDLKDLLNICSVEAQYYRAA